MIRTGWEQGHFPTLQPAHNTTTIVGPKEKRRNKYILVLSFAGVRYPEETHITVVWIYQVPTKADMTVNTHMEKITAQRFNPVSVFV